jgi:tetratricopeptide (TPR) repeat protein
MSIQPQLTLLEDSGLVRLITHDPDLEYLFRHALIQEAAYESLLKTDRRQLHRAVADTLERLYIGQTDELAAVLAMHLIEAEEDQRALAYFNRAGELAAQQYALPEAVAAFSQALTIAHRNQSSLTQLYRRRGLAFDTLGEFEKARSDLEQGLVSAKAEGNGRDEWQLALDLGLLWSSRDYGRAGDYLRQAQGLAQALGDRTMLAHSQNRIGNWYMNSGQPQAARKHHQQALKNFEAENDAAGLAATHDLLGMTNAILGNVDESQAHYRQALLLFRQQHNPFGLVAALAMLAVTGSAEQADRNSHALAYGAEAVQAALQAHWPSGEAYARFTYSLSLDTSGHFADALEQARAGLTVAEAIGHRQWILANHNALGVIYLDLRALAEARQHLELAWELADEIQSQHWREQVGSFLAMVCVRQGDLARAESLVQLFPVEAPLTINQRFGLQARAALALQRGQPDLTCTLLAKLWHTGEWVSVWGVHNLAQFAVDQAEALSQLDRLGEAESGLKQVRQQLAQSALAFRLWQVDLELAALYRQQGRLAEADAAQQQAQVCLQATAAEIPAGPLREHFIQIASSDGR